MLEKGHPAANRKGFGHIAFHVEDVKFIFEKVISFGGRAIGEITSKEVTGLGGNNITPLLDNNV